MANILAIETSGSVCGVGIWQTNNTPIIMEEIGSKIHSEKLPEFIKIALEKSKLSLKEIDAIAVSAGPGSYTGLRIGMSFAKGLAFGSGIQILPINTMECIEYGIHKNEDYTILIYSHAGFVYEKNILNSNESKIVQTEIKDVYPNPIVCVNFPENKKNLENADYILPSVNYVGDFTQNNYNHLERPNLNEISPGYFSEFKIRK